MVICPQGKYGANIRIGPQIFVFALKYPYVPSYIRICPEFNFRYLRSGLKVQGKMMHKDMHKIVFQSNWHISTYWNKVKITWNGIISSYVYVVLNRNFHSNVNVLGRFYKQVSNVIVQIDALKDLFSQFVSSEIFLQLLSQFDRNKNSDDKECQTARAADIKTHRWPLTRTCHYLS